MDEPKEPEPKHIDTNDSIEKEKEPLNPSEIDASVYSFKKKAMYFFKGDQYYKCVDGDLANSFNEYPKPIEGNWDVPIEWARSNVDAALYSAHWDAIYLFKGD